MAALFNLGLLSGTHDSRNYDKYNNITELSAPDWIILDAVTAHHNIPLIDDGILFTAFLKNNAIQDLETRIHRLTGNKYNVSALLLLKPGSHIICAYQNADKSLSIIDNYAKNNATTTLGEILDKGYNVSYILMTKGSVSTINPPYMCTWRDNRCLTDGCFAFFWRMPDSFFKTLIDELPTYAYDAEATYFLPLIASMKKNNFKITEEATIKVQTYLLQHDSQKYPYGNFGTVQSCVTAIIKELSIFSSDPMNVKLPLTHAESKNSVSIGVDVIPSYIYNIGLPQSHSYSTTNNDKKNNNKTQKFTTPSTNTAVPNTDTTTTNTNTTTRDVYARICNFYNDMCIDLKNTLHNIWDQN